MLSTQGADAEGFKEKLLKPLKREKVFQGVEWFITEDPDSVPSTFSGWLPAVCNSSSK